MIVQDVEEQNLLDLYRRTFARFSYNNDLYAETSFHVLTGQILKDVMIYKGGIALDSRISLFLLQPSGSGKTTAYRLIDAIGSRAGLAVRSLDEITDAALIGTIDYDRDTDQYDIVPGLLSEADILHYDEASTLLKTTTTIYSKGTLAFLQKSLNPIGDPSSRIYKKLAKGPPIEVEPTCSFLLTSYIPENIMEVILGTGFFQRLLTVVRRLTRQDRLENAEHDLELLGHKIDSEPEVGKIAQELRTIKKEINSDNTVEITERVKPVIRNRTQNLFQAITVPNQKVSDLLDTFVPRYLDQMYRLAVHSCVLSDRRSVSTRDINYAFNILFNPFKLLMSWLESDERVSKTPTREKETLEMVVRVYRKMDKDKAEEKWVRSTQLVDNLTRVLRLSKPTVYRWLNIFTEQGRLEIKKKGRTAYYSIPAEVERAKVAKK